jgi:hypothetical protein
VWTDIEIIEPEADWFDRRADWQESWAWLPHRSAVSAQWIWLKTARLGTVRYSDGLVMEQRWMTKNEWVIYSLTKNTVK